MNINDLGAMNSNELPRGILPVNAHVEVNILNLNYIYSFIFYSSKNRFSNDIHCTINNLGACCFICFKALYFQNISLLSAVFTANRNYQ